LVMVFAARGVGKTFFALNVAYAVACGGRFLKWEAPEPRSVLYLDGEMPATLLQQRLAEIVEDNDQAEPQKPLNILSAQLQDLDRGMLDLSKFEDLALLEPHLKDIDLIILDNLSTLCRSGRENEAETWTIIQDWGILQRSRGRSVLFIHHAGKGGDQRGSSRKEDTLDCVLDLRHPQDYDPENGCEFEVHFTKTRLLYGDDAQPIVARLQSKEGGAPAWCWKTLDESNLDKVKRLLSDGMRQKDIVIELELSKGYVSKLVRQIEREARKFPTQETEARKFPA
jgi:putative DNA primase/helicase